MSDISGTQYNEPTQNTSTKNINNNNFPNNCPVIEKTANGFPVGRCWEYLERGVCSRHGRIKKNKK